MGRQTGFLYGFNAGVISREGLARVDQSAARVAGEVQENIIPRVLGAGIFRPGLRYFTRTYNDELNTLIPFVFNATTTALIELAHSGNARFIIDGVPVARAAVSTAIANGGFTTDLASWTDADEAGAASVWESGQLMELKGTGTARAIRYQAVSVSGPDQSVEHGVRIVVDRGPVFFSIGTTIGGVEIITEQSLNTGTHSLAFTPGAATIYIQFASEGTTPAYVDSVAIEGAGDVVITHPWNSKDRARTMQYVQSGDILFCGHPDFPPRRFERRSQRSWSLTDYEPTDGPFRAENTTSTTLTPAGKGGIVNVTASRPIFQAGHVGTIWRVTHGQTEIEAVLSAEDTWSDPIRVSGFSGAERVFDYKIVHSGGPNTIKMQRSFTDSYSWQDLEDFGTAAVSTFEAYDDGRENQIIYYRLGIPTGGYVGGTTTVTLKYSNASQTGRFRVRSLLSASQVRTEVLSPFGSTDATNLWNEPEWSSVRGWPGAVALFDGRLWWGARDKVYGSISDAYESFDDELEGDAGTINRSIATGPFERIIWLRGAQRLLAGTATEEVSIRSSAFDEPITPTEFTARSTSQYGSGVGVEPVRVGASVIYVQRNLKRVLELVYDSGAQDYVSRDLTRLVPDICDATITDAAIQMMPDKRIWFVLNDGSAVCLLFEPEEDAVAWVTVTLGVGSIQSVAVLPGDDEDEVYFTIKRGAIRTIERLAQLNEVTGGDLNCSMDGFVEFLAHGSDTLTGLTHLEDQEVVVWADGAPLVTADAPLTVSSGSVTLPASVTNAVVGIPYTGKFKSVNLDYGAQYGTALAAPQKLVNARLLMKDTAPEGVQVGPSFDDLHDLPKTYQERTLAAGEVIADFAHDVWTAAGWERDLRICFQVQSPYPATFLGVAFDVETGEGVDPPQG